MRKRLLLLPCLLLISALALAACGGSSSSGDESQIEETIETAATSTDSSYCSKLQTQQFDEQTTGDEGPKAQKVCEEESSMGEQAESAEVAEVEVNGSEATAEVTFTGSPLNEQSLEVALIKEGDQWQLNELVGFTKLDKPALAKAVGETVAEQGGQAAEAAPCVEEALEEGSQTEIEELIISGSSVPLEKLFEGCLSS